MLLPGKGEPLRGRDAARRTAMRDDGELPAAERLDVDLADVRIAARSWGQGELLLCLHGGMGLDGATLEGPGVVGLAAAGRRVLIPDQRGHGRSGRSSEEDYRHEVWAADAVALADALGAGRFTLLGHSYGGFIALEVALRWPERLRSLVLVASSAGPVAGRVPRVEGDAELREVMRRAWPAMFAGSDHHWEVFERTRFSAAPCRAAFERELPRYDLRERVPSFEVATLLVVGDRDPYLDDMAWLAAALPAARLEVLAGVGHMPHLEVPERFRRAVDGFLREG